MTEKKVVKKIVSKTKVTTPKAKAAKSKAKTVKSKVKVTTPKAKAAKSKAKAAKSKAKKVKEEQSDDMGIVIVDDDITIDQEKVNEERRAYLEESRSQDAYD
ncbi:MAG: hypothetical protein HYT44_00275 [Nitrosarchaeum sp.]|nr:hypothetical protein [Nitrosarchaeum sp.]